MVLFIVPFIHLYFSNTDRTESREKGILVYELLFFFIFVLNKKKVYNGMFKNVQDTILDFSKFPFNFVDMDGNNWKKYHQ